LKNINSNMGKQYIRQLLDKKRYYFAKCRIFLTFYLSNLGAKESLIIYQMGKVGSSTILKSLEALELDIPIFHIHTLTQEGFNHGEKIYRDSGNRYSPRGTLWKSIFLRKQIDKGLNKKKYKVVTLVRDPIASGILRGTTSSLRLGEKAC